MSRPLLKRFPDCVQLDAAVAPAFGDFDISRRWRFVERSNFGKRGFSFFKINGLAIVGVDETEVPQIGTLINVRNSRRSDLEKCLRETVCHTVERDLLLKFDKVVEKLAFCAGLEDRGDESFQGLLVTQVWARPARVDHRLAGRLDRVLFQSTDQRSSIAVER